MALPITCLLLLLLLAAAAVVVVYATLPHKEEKSRRRCCPSPCVTVVGGGARFFFSFILASRWNRLAHLLLLPLPLPLPLSHALVLRSSTAAVAAAAAEALPSLPPRRPPPLQHGMAHRANCTASFYTLRVRKSSINLYRREFCRIAHFVFKLRAAPWKGAGEESPEKKGKKKK